MVTIIRYLSALILLLATVSSELADQMAKVDSLLSKQGPSMEVLQEYSSLIPRLKKLAQSDASARQQLSRVHYKKGIVEFSLKQDNLAVEDFENCLQFDSSFKPCQQELNKLNLKLGRISELESYILANTEKVTDPMFQKLNEQYKDLKEHCALIEDSILKKDFDRCVNLTSYALDMASSFSAMRQLRSYCLQQIPPQSFVSGKLNMLISDYSDLTKSSQPSLPSKAFPQLDMKFNGLENFVKLFQLEAFVSTNSRQPQKTIQKCLRVDNEYSSCAAYSKLYSKITRFRELFAKASLYYSHTYFKSEDNIQQSDESLRIEEFELTPEEWDYMHKLLFEEKIKFTPKMLDSMEIGARSFNNYYELLTLLARKADDTFNIPEDKNLFLRDLQRVAIESTVTPKEKLSLCKSLPDHDGFLPCQIVQVDKFLKAKSYEKAEKILDRFDNRVRKTRLWRTRYEVLDREYLTAKRAEQQREEAFRRQRQQQQQQQRFYQQQQQNRPKPKNDYYKILEVSRDADEATIKKAYRNKVKQNHPDKLKNSNKSQEEIEATMAKINNAYEVLSNKESREKYDLGHDVNDPESRAQPQGHQFHNGGFQFRNGAPNFFQGGFQGGAGQNFFQSNNFQFKMKKNRGR